MAASASAAIPPDSASTRREDWSDIRPQTKELTSDAAAEASTRTPSCCSTASPPFCAATTSQGGANAVDTSSPRTRMKRRSALSSLRNLRMGGRPASASALAPGSSSDEKTAAAVSHNSPARAMAMITGVCCCISPDISSSAKITTPTEATDPASPVTAPRRVLAMVRPKTSLVLTEQAALDRASTARSTQMASPAAVPSSVRATPAMPSAASPCPMDPVTHIQRRCVIRFSTPA